MSSRIVFLDQVQMYFTDQEGDLQVLVVDGDDLEVSIEAVMGDRVYNHKPHIVISCGDDTEINQYRLDEDGNPEGFYDDEDDE